MLDFFQKSKIDQLDFSTCLKISKYIVEFFSEEESMSLHYCVVGEVLREAGGIELEKEEIARNLLVRELVKECKDFAGKCCQVWNEKLNHENQDLFFIGREVFFLDALFSRHVLKIGNFGKKISEELIKASKEWRKAYLRSNNSLDLCKIWIDLTRPPYYCRYLKLLSEILWKDRIEDKFLKNKKNLPALTQSVQRPVSCFLSSRANILIKNGIPSVSYEGKIVAEIAAIDPKLIPLVMKGTNNLNSIYHHKLLRHECKVGFDNWVNGKSDPRVIRYEGGETELARILGFKFKEAPSIIKSILYAQAFMNFYFDDGSMGNLIAIRQFRSKVTNREEGLEIVLGTQLMPYYTFQTDRKSRLLVPLPDLPPFVSAPQYHAGQALLQMLIMEEFTNKSVELAEQGSIYISSEKWNDFLKQSGLPESIFQQTCNRWLQDAEDGARFLVQIEDGRFTIGEKYSKELNFLLTQGMMRKERQLQGRMAAKKKKQLQQTSI